MKEMAKKAVHKHERAMHPGKPMTKMAAGGKLSMSRADMGSNMPMTKMAAGGKLSMSRADMGSNMPMTKMAKGGKTELNMKKMGRNLAKVANQNKPMRSVPKSGI